MKSEGGALAKLIIVMLYHKYRLESQGIIILLIKMCGPPITDFMASLNGLEEGTENRWAG
jgi:hypothetical protein